MAFKKKNNNKIYAAIILVAIIAIAAAAIVYATNQPAPSSKSIMPGVHAGDTFFYNITGYDDANPDSVNPNFGIYNDTTYYEVAITSVSGSVVYLISDWKLTNGTLIQNLDWINLENGNVSGDFWAIYPPNLTSNNLLYPQEENTALIVNSTTTRRLLTLPGQAISGQVMMCYITPMTQQAAHRSTITYKSISMRKQE